MPFVPALNTVRTAIEFINTYGDTAANVMHFRSLSGAPVSAAILDLHTAITDWLTANWKGIASNQWQSDLIKSVDLTVPDGITETSIVTVSGNIASPTLPSQNTIAVSLRTGLSGRSRRGRTYHVGLSEQQVTGSRVNLLDASLIPVQYEQLITFADGAGWEWVVASFVSGGAPRATALLTPITSCILTDTVVDSMDTRKPRGA